MVIDWIWGVREKEKINIFSLAAVWMVLPFFIWGAQKMSDI